jgi:hypothetical protein
VVAAAGGKLFSCAGFHSALAGSNPALTTIAKNTTKLCLAHQCNDDSAGGIMYGIRRSALFCILISMSEGLVQLFTREHLRTTLAVSPFLWLWGKVKAGVSIAPKGSSSHKVGMAQMYSGSSVRSYLILSVALALHSPTENLEAPLLLLR